MFPRSHHRIGQLSAQAVLARGFAFACGGLRPHLGAEAGHFLRSAIHMAGIASLPCVPSPDFLSGPAWTGHLFRKTAARSCFCAVWPQGARLSAQPRDRDFWPQENPLHSGSETTLNGGRACVFLPLPFSRHSRWQPRAACSPAAATMPVTAISRRRPTRCKPRAAVPLPGLFSGRLSPMPPMKTWSQGQPSARWPVAHPAVCRVCPLAADRLIASPCTASAGGDITLKAIRARRPDGLLSLLSCARRPARV